jgi:Tol biopolymer transport system component
MIGTKLAHYEIVTHLGSGGMGDVYQATDTKLGRSVAIKFLPEAFSHDTDRVLRFQREARVLASLNHPNIAAIHGVEEIDTRHFLVMELVPGETLADRIRRGAIPIEEALPIAKQIAEALEEAHEKGVVHRDLKPANIKVTPDGKVKVLDFGLAKAYESEQANVVASNSPTMLSMAATNAGVILGTAAYMSPEQASGKTVDKRTDLWAFGVVLMEMLTGRPVFEGETVSHVLAAVLTKDPDWSALSAKTPMSIRRLLRRCLEKDRKRRLDSATATRLEIEEAQTAPTAEVTPVGAAEPAASSHVAWIISVVAVLLAVGVAVVHFREAPPATPPEMRLDIVTPATTDPASFALSPDGRQIVFVASDDGVPRLWVRSLAGTTAQPLPGTEGARLPFWSPDSKSIGFFSGTKLKRIDTGGGQVQMLANATFGVGGAWNPDGVILFTPSTTASIFRIPSSGGEPVAVTKLDGTPQLNHRLPQFLPDGRQFLFFVQGAPDIQGIYLGSLDSVRSKRLTAADTAGLYAPPSWLLFVRQGSLVARHFDPLRGEVTGDPITVGGPVSVDVTSLIGAFSVSATGLIAYRAGRAPSRQLTWFDRSGKILGKLGAPDDSLADPHLSSDGRRVAVDRIVQSNTDIWLLDAYRTTRLTFDAAPDTRPIWSPDANRIVFDSDRTGKRDLYQKPANGASSEELLVDSPQSQIKNAEDWSADGRFILYQSQDPKTDWDLWVLPLDGDRKPFVFLKTNFEERHAQFSPDGRWVAYRSNESGTAEIYVRPFPGPGGQWQISTSGGIAPRWRHDGKELYYIAPDGRLMAVPIATKAGTLEPGTPVALFRTQIVGGGTNTNRQQYDVATDGRFLINTAVEDAAVSPVTILQNWQPPAK